MMLLETTAKVTLILLCSLLAAASMRRKAAAVRHWILAVGLACACAMPLLQAVTPVWGVPASSVHAIVSNVAPTLAGEQPLTTPLGAVWSGPIAPHATLLLRSAVWVWSAGVLILLVLLCTGLARLAWVAGRCEPVIDPTWTLALIDIAAHLRIRRDVILLQSDRHRLLVTSGLLSPKIILPRGAAEWSVDRIRVVLCHELSHVRRRDAALQMLAGLMCAIYWFNPLVWMATWWLRHESERACDDDVLTLGMEGSDYATELLHIARLLRPAVWSPAPGMARSSSLQRRVRAMLNATIDRRPLTSARRITIATGALLLTIAVAGSGAAAQVVGAAFSGSFVDALRNAIPNVTMTLKNTRTGEQFTVRSDSDGQFTFDALPDGDYQGEVNAVGFTTIHPFFRIKDGTSAVQPSVIPLPLGTIEETITVRDDGSAASPAPRALALDRLVALRQRAQAMPLAPPIKTRDVRPLFPPARKGEDATVFLEGIIDTNGVMKGLQVMQPADSEFGRAASDAINDWQFEPTRLQGVAVDTAIHVTVIFVH
jgi:TonB family protein